MTRRRSLADLVPDFGEQPAAIPEHPPAEPDATVATAPAAPAPRRQRAPRAARAENSRAKRTAARDLAAPARQSIPREAIKVDVPAELELLHRLRRRQLDTGMLIRDQVAIAVDEALTRDGY